MLTLISEILIHTLYVGEAGKLIDLQSVNKDWILSVLIETFTTTRHHRTGMVDKMKAKEFIVNHFENLTLTVEYDEFQSIDGVSIILCCLAQTFSFIPCILNNGFTHGVFSDRRYILYRNETK